MLSAKELQKRNVALKSGEGDAFSGSAGAKEVIFIGESAEGLGTGMAYAKMYRESPHYNPALIKDQDLDLYISKLKKYLSSQRHL